MYGTGEYVCTYLLSDSTKELTQYKKNVNLAIN